MRGPQMAFPEEERTLISLEPELVAVALIVTQQFVRLA